MSHVGNVPSKKYTFLYQMWVSLLVSPISTEPKFVKFLELNFKVLRIELFNSKDFKKFKSASAYDKSKKFKSP